VKKLLVLYVILILGMTVMAAQDKMSTRLQDAVNVALENNAPVRALVMLKDRVDIIALDQDLYARKASPQERAFTVISALQERADQTQPAVVQALEGKSATEIVKVERFWVANMLLLEAVPSVLVEVAQRTDVAYMDLDANLQWDKPVDRRPAPLESPSGIEPGIAAINAPAMWKAGFTGNGVIVMNIDTGVDANHPALSYKWRGTHVPASQAWFDANGGSTFPNDCDDHGTHTCGTMNGLNPATHDTIGVAFGAEWIAAKTICTSGSHTSLSISAFQWAMDPDQNPNTVDDMPVAIGNSWWDPDIAISTQCDPNYDPYINVLTAVEAAGIAVVFSAGNNGPTPQSVTAPKNVNIDEVSFWATGAVDANTAGYPIASFSSRGPVVTSCQTGVPSLDIKPEASAPGVGVRSSIIGGNYAFYDGTSMACPHVVGAIALLKEAHPSKTGHELKMALYQTARDLGPVGEDNDYGMGIIDVYAAHLALADPLDPKSPRNFTAYSDYTTPTSMALAWTDPTNYENGDTLLAVDFTIEIEKDGFYLTSVNGGTENYMDNGLTDGQFYTYKIYSKVTANDSTSSEVETSWTAGGSPVPNAPHTFYVTEAGSDLQMNWTNPSRNLDGTPMDDFAGINLYEDGTLAATYNRTSSDTGSVDSETFTPSAGTHQYYVTAFDNETPVNESVASNIAYSPLSLPFFDDFPVAGAPNAAYWLNDNAEVNDLGVNPPSPPYVLNLDGYPHVTPEEGDIVTLLPLDLSSAAGQGMVLSFWYQPEGNGDQPESTDSLIVEFLNDQNTWIKVRSWPGEPVKPFENVVISVDAENPGTGATFFFPSFQFRFRNMATIDITYVFDTWLIDNVFFGIPDANPTLSVSPLVLNDTLLIGATDVLTFTIENTTQMPSILNFSVTQDPVVSWLNVSPTSGIVPSNSFADIAVELSTAGLSAGNYTTNLIVAADDTTNTADTVVVNLQLNEPPVVGFTPDSLHFSLDPNQADSLGLTISNSGTGPLNFSLRDEEIQSLYAEGRQIDRSYLKEEFNVEIPKGTDDWRRGTPQTEGSGGPDLYGYKWFDSDEPGGPVPNYMDISSTGTVGVWTYGTSDDGRIDGVVLPFPVKFYGVEYNTITIISNGWVGFNTDYTISYLTNAQIPDTALPNNIVAALWDDLNGDNPSSAVYYQQVGNKFVIQFKNWNRYGHTGGDLNFEYIFYMNSDVVELQYSTMNFGTGTNSTSHTIGIENADGTDGLQVVFDAAYIHDNMAIRFSKEAGWLSENPVSGIVPAGGSQDVQVIANSSGLLGGDHYASVVIESNDPITPDTSMTVRLTVSGIPDINVTPDTLVFDTLLVGATQDLTLEVANTGTFTLNVSDITATNAAFSLDTTAFSLSPLTSLTVTVTFSPLAAGAFDGWLLVASDAPDSPVDSTYVMGVAEEAPVVGFTPDTLQFTLDPNQADSLTMTISNSGNGPLNFTLRDEEIFSLFSEKVEVDRSYLREEFNVDIPKGMNDWRRGTPQTEGSGGPDLYGYKWIDSDEPGGPVPNYTDISSTGTVGVLTTGTMDDGLIANLSLPFNIKFYGVEYSSITISTNGWVGFSSSYSSNYLTNAQIPGTALPNDIVAGLWDDLNGNNISSNIYYQQVGNKFIIQLHNWNRYGQTGGDLNFQYVFYQNSDVIELQYATMNFGTGTNNLSHTIGIENADGTDGLQVVFEAAYIHDDMAIRFSKGADWLSQNPASGTVPAGGSVDVQVKANSTGLLGGNYNAAIIIESNDPANPLVNAYAHMVVIGKPMIATAPDPLEMDTTFTGGEDSQTLWVKNVGTDTLYVLDITSTNTLFTVDTTNFVVAPPADSFAVKVSFNPLVVGSFDGYLIVQSNDPDTPLDSTMVTGVAVEAPIISVNPSSMQMQMHHQGDSLDVYIEISNLGGSMLEWTAEMISFESASGKTPNPPSVPPSVPSGNPVAAADVATDLGGTPRVTLLPGYYPVNFIEQNLLYDNGPYINSPGTGVGGADESVVQTNLGLSVWGIGHQYASGISIADDFTVTGGGWQIDSLVFYAYQTGSTTTSTMTGVYYRIWDGSPDNAASSIIYGDLTTNKMVRSQWAGVYRVLDTASGVATDRPVMRNTASADIFLMPGTYWIEWMTDGTLASGPWAPPISINGQTTTGNALQYYLAVWGPVLDDGTQTQQGFPFLLKGSAGDQWIKMMDSHQGTVAAGAMDSLHLRIYALTMDTVYVANIEIRSNDPALPAVVVQISLSTMLVGITDLEEVPTTFDIFQNYPNPFNPETNIKYQIPRSSDVKLVIYNILGQKVRTLVNGRMDPGRYTVVWNGRNDMGNQVASGIYIYRFEAADFRKTMKLMLLK